jgi:aldehyde:ferredoxin oxidoreductase
MAFYQVRGWDNETGFPTAEILKEYDLPQVADELEKYRTRYLKKINNPTDCES